MITSFLLALAAEKGAALLTQDAYRRDLEGADETLHSFGSQLLSASSDDLQRLVMSWHQSGLKAATTARRLSALRQYYAFLSLEKIRDDNPSLMLDSPKLSQNLPVALSEDEVVALINACAHCDDKEMALCAEAALEMLYSTGLRISECLALKASDLGQRDNAISIKGKGGKERLVLVNDVARNKVKIWLDWRDKHQPHFLEDVLFSYKGKALGRRQFTFIIKQVAAIAGIAPSRVSAHKLRHSFATHMLNRGADLRSLQNLLGHADISTTQIYTKTRSDRLAGLVSDMHPLASLADDE